MTFLHTAAHGHTNLGGLLLHALTEGLRDGLLSLPILFAAYLLMELL